MPTPITTIHASDFINADELFENGQILSSGSFPTHFICQLGTAFQRVPKSRIFGLGQNPRILSSGTTSYGLSGTVLLATDVSQIWQDVSTGWRVKVNGTDCFSVSSAFLKLKLFVDLQTSPVGGGIDIYADGFIEWSMARIKEQITDIPAAVANKPLRPRVYVQKNRSRLGFVAEESPSEVVISTHNEEGVEEYGIDVLAVCALQQAKIDKLEARIAALEARK